MPGEPAEHSAPERTGLWTVADLAGMLKVPVSWVYEHVRLRGKERIPHLKLGKYLRFQEAEVRAWLGDLRER